MAWAALWGTSVGYHEIDDFVQVETIDGRIMMVRRPTFDYLYARLDDYTAALKENCIEYVVHHDNMSFEDCPLWYILAIEDGYIAMYGDDGCEISTFLTEYGEIPMSEGSIIMRNFMGGLRYMESKDFTKYYDIIGE